MASSFLSLFIFYIFFFVIIRGVRKKSKSSEVKPNTPAKSAQQSAEVFRNPQPVQSRPTTTTSRPATSSYTSHNPVSTASQAKKPAQGEPPKHSTMGYLHEKAKQDEEEHRKEEAETARKMKQRSDGRIPGRQLLLGDPVPANCRCVICGYCGAENLLPLNSGSRDKYCCYFCREALEK